MRVLDLFSAAAGGWSLGLHRAGFTTVAACEFVDWRRALYAENNPGVPIYDDVRTLTAERLRADLGALPDVVVGSPPCQDISSANTKGKGVDGERSGLFFEAVRIIGEVRPRWFALENSANLRTRGADRVLGELEARGYAVEPCVVGAVHVGANHERQRSWLIGFDPTQLAHAPRLGRLAWPGNFEGDVKSRDGSFAGDVAGGRPALHAAGLGHEGRRTRGHGQDGDGAPHAGDAQSDGRGSGRPGRRAVATPGLPVEACGDAAGDAPDADQARQAHGCGDPGLRQAEIADHGRGDVRRDDVADADRQWQPDLAEHDEVGRRESSGGHAGEPWADWNGGLAHHLRVDDGLSAWVAGARIAVGGPRGTAAASLIVEAFGDAVVPQIPEAIGRAILRTEAALAAIYGREAA